jgi:hypothetical protein
MNVTCWAKQSFDDRTSGNVEKVISTNRKVRKGPDSYRERKVRKALNTNAFLCVPSVKA